MIIQVHMVKNMPFATFVIQFKPKAKYTERWAVVEIQKLDGQKVIEDADRYQRLAKEKGYSIILIEGAEFPNI